jgi:YD repeat-containing protein
MLNYSDNRPLAYSGVSVSKFASVADFVGDAPRIQVYGTLETHPMTTTVRITTPGLLSTSTSTYSYDAQRRPARIAIQNDAGGSDVQTFNAWDTFGRPTAATTNRESFTYAYDDAARTMTLTNVSAGGVITQTFDANGNQIRQVSVSSTESGTATVTIQATATVCR